MGLFSNNKKRCPICGEATPRLFSRKVEDQPLCKDCAKKIFLPDGALDAPLPFERYYLHLELDHPYWPTFEGTLDAPSFDSTDPTVLEYLHDYDRKARELHTLAGNLMLLLNPNAPVYEGDEAPAAPTAPTTPAAHEDMPAQLTSLKSLLDAGILTEEEFTAKKRQILGL